MRKATVLFICVTFAALWLGYFARGISIRTDPSGVVNSKHPVMKSEVLNIGGSTVMGVKLFQRNGRTLAYFFQADRGIIVCPHFDIDILGRAGTPTATAKNWSEHDFRGELDEKILRANQPAVALGVKPGMTVREVLILMSKRKGVIQKPWQERVRKRTQ